MGSNLTVRFDGPYSLNRVPSGTESSVASSVNLRNWK